jgi:hypothetical protein
VNPSERVIVGTAVISLVVVICFFYIQFLRQGIGEDYWQEFVQSQFPLVFGLPIACVVAFGLVIVFSLITSSPDNVYIGNFSLEGVAGPLFIWVVVFLSLVFAIKMLTRR